jgi:hypothetical protein
MLTNYGLGTNCGLMTNGCELRTANSLRALSPQSEIRSG